MTTGQKVFWAVAALIAAGWMLGGNGGTKPTGGPTKSESAASAPALRGDTVLVNTDFLGCRQMDDVERLISLLQQHDTAAADALFREKAETCSKWFKQDQALVEDVSVFHNLTCIRAKGEPYCMWFPTTMLSKV